MSVYKTPLMESQDLESLDLAKTQTAQNTQSGRRHSTQAAVVFNPVGASPISHTLELDMPKIDITDMNYSTAQAIEDINRRTEKEYEEALREYYLRLRDDNFVSAPKEFWINGEWEDARDGRHPSDIEHEFDVTNINDRAAIAYVKVMHRFSGPAHLRLALMNDKTIETNPTLFRISPQEPYRPHKGATGLRSRIESPRPVSTLDAYFEIKVPGTLTYRSEYDEHGEFSRYVPYYRNPEHIIDITEYMPYSLGETALEIGGLTSEEGHFGTVNDIQTWAYHGFVWYYERPYNTNEIDARLLSTDSGHYLHITSYSVFARYITLHVAGLSGYEEYNYDV